MKITEWMKQINGIDERVVLGILNNHNGNLAREFAYMVYREEKEREQKKEPYKKVTYYMDKFELSEAVVNRRLELTLRDITRINEEVNKGNEFFIGSGINSRTFNVLRKWKRHFSISSENFASALLEDITKNNANAIRRIRGCGPNTYNTIVKELERYYKIDLHEFNIEEINKYYYSEIL